MSLRVSEQLKQCGRGVNDFNQVWKSLKTLLKNVCIITKPEWVSRVLKSEGV